MYDEVIEKAMLYHVIFEKEQYLLDENDFVNVKNKQIINAINELKANKEEVSMLTIKSKIKTNSKQVLAYLSTLIDYSYGTSAETIYNKLIEFSKKRKMLELLQTSISEVEETENIDILSEKIIKNINEIQKIENKEKTFLEQVVEVTEEIEKSVKQETDYSLYTGMIELDKVICGLHKQELTIIGARPRSWKNNLCIANSRTYSAKRSRNSNNKLRDVRLSNNKQNSFKKNKNKYIQNEIRNTRKRRIRRNRTSRSRNSRFTNTPNNKSENIATHRKYNKKTKK